LEISDSDHSVKCQKCGIAVPIVGKLTARNDRIAVLQKQIKWIEEHAHYHGGSNNKDGGNIKQLKQELGELLEDEKSGYRFRSISVEKLQ
jgi:hypothetical protein